MRWARSVRCRRSTREARLLLVSVHHRATHIPGAKARKSKLTFPLPLNTSVHCQTIIYSLFSVSISNDFVSRGKERGLF